MLELSEILVVDDEPMNVELLKAILQSKLYHVVVASNGVEALTAIATKKIDLVLLDVMMPLMDGFEVTRRIRADSKTKNLPVILLTALHETSERITGIEAGCDEFVTKPFDKNEVLARIKTLLRLTYYRSQIDEKEKFEHIIDRMNDGLIVCNPDLSIARSNQKARELLNSEDVSAGWLDRMASRFQVGYAGDLKKELLQGNLDFFMERPESVAAKSLILFFGSSLIRDPDGKPQSIVILLHDATQRRQEINAQNSFLGLMSQKLKTPLDTSIEHLALLQKSTATIENKPFKKSVEITVEKVTDFLRMISKIFDFLAVDVSDRRSGPAPAKDFVAMDQLESLVRAEARKAPQGRRVELHFDLPGGLQLPLSPALCVVLMQNLVENAVKFSDKPLLTLAVAARQEGKQIQLSVRDNGPGIPSEERRNVFYSFYQVARHGAGSIEGLGMGLAIVKKIMLACQGDAAVELPPGGGTTIRLSFPLAAQPEARPHPAPQKALAHK